MNSPAIHASAGRPPAGPGSLLAPAPRSAGDARAAARAPASPVTFEIDMYDDTVRPGRRPDPSIVALDPAPVTTHTEDDLGPTLDRWTPNPRDDAPAAEMTLADVVDIFNPLQHIPLIGELYRALTGDEISAPARIAGGALFGGPIGFVTSLVNAVATEANNGQDPGETVIATLIGHDAPAPTRTDMAASYTRQTPDTTPASFFIPASTAAAPVSAGMPPLPASDGAVAFQAVARDLRAGATMASQGTFAARSADSPPSRPSPGASTAGAGVDGFTERMMKGLERYRALTLERGGPGRPFPTDARIQAPEPGARLDRRL